MESPVKTLVIDNFQGRLTRYLEGDANSGFAKYSTTFGNDPFTTPGNLTWFEAPQQIDPDADVITDLIMAQSPRLESGITYVYAIGHTGRLYKIQVNDPTTFNPNYDNPVLLTTLTAESPTFKYGASIQFYGATEKMFIGHDKGVTKVNFDGSGETFVGSTGSWTQDVPRMSVNFTGSLYFTNGTNIAQIDSTELVVTYTKLSPGFPSGTQARDIDVSTDGNYVQAIVSRVPQPDLTTATQDTNSLSSGDSYRFLWNGTDEGATASTTFNSYSINANLSFGDSSYTLGYDLGGAAIYSGNEKIVSLPLSNCPVPQAIYSIGNLLGFGAPEQDQNVQTASLLVYGPYDNEIPSGLFRFFRNEALGVSDTDPTLPTVGESGASAGNWTDPSNITADDSNFAYYRAINSGSVTDLQVNLVKANGTSVAENKALSTPWPTSQTSATYGGPDDLWGTTWSPSDINGASFGAKLFAQVVSENTNFLYGNTFGFSIQDTATIRGIELEISRRSFTTTYGGFQIIRTQGEVYFMKINVYYVDPGEQQNVLQMPTCQVVSNLLLGSSTAGYSDNQVGSAKLYFSTNETSEATPNQYKLYKFTTVPTGLGTTIGGVYETQNQLFSKKVQIKGVRMYFEPLVDNNSFQIGLIGSGNTPLISKTFTAGSDPVAVGDDFIWWTPEIAPTYSIGLRVTNLGTTNMVINKIEIDYAAGGQ